MEKISDNILSVIVQFIALPQLDTIRRISRRYNTFIKSRKNLYKVWLFGPKYIPILHKLIQTSNFCEVYDLKSKKALLYTSNQSFPDNFDSIQIGNLIYYCGGKFEEENSFIRDSYSIELQENRVAISSLSPMHIQKGHHTLAQGLCQESFISIGGYNLVDNELRECEQYVIAENSWFTFPNLSEPKSECSCCIFDSYIIYSFGGHNGLQNVQTIEMINLLMTHRGWKIVLPTSLINCSSSGIVQLSSNSILIFGGSIGNDKVYDVVNTCYEFRIENNSFKELQNLPQSDDFYQCKAIKIKNEVLCVGFFNPNIYEFNIPLCCWKSI